ncbi:MAG: hypothetical protein NC311_06760 [Muribaculaceae bacterium]|nr:hypothetical protein [Muribaculaceae bacterium]
MDKQVVYLALLTLHENNFRGLHWKLHGPSFNTDHLRFGEYYEKLGQFMDETAELMISMGVAPVGVAGLMNILNSDEVNTSYIDMEKNYSADAANVAAKQIFNELYGYAADLAKDESIPVDMQDIYAGHAAYYRIEGMYKLGRTLLPKVEPISEES